MRPNILFVLADDMGYADLACYGGQGVQTPNIDRLAREGIRFTQFYVNSPLCSPSRTALTTGQYPARWNITSFIDNRNANEGRGMAQWLDLNAPTLARSLSGAGYLTGHFGKWHMGGGRDVGEAPLPTQYGFAQSLTQFEGLGDRVLPIMSKEDGKPAQKLGLGVASEKLGRGKVTWVPRADVTTSFVQRALGFMKAANQAGKPFYINLWPDDVHSPYDPPQALRGDGSKRALYRGVVTNMDKELGPLLDAVRNDPKLRANTLIVFASDNGPEAGSGLAGPFRGGKGELFEGGIREPFIVWGPGLLPPSRQGTVNSSAVVSGVDLLPSLLKLAGATTIPTTDGSDLSALLSGQSTTGRTQPLFWKRPPDRAGTAGQVDPDLAVREGDWKLLVQEDGTQPHLYNLAQDPGETQDLAGAQPQTVQRLQNAVLAWNRTLPAATHLTGAVPEGKTHFDLQAGATLGRNRAPQIAQRGFTLTAKFDTTPAAGKPVAAGQPDTTPHGVLVAQGGEAQGYALYFDATGHLTFLVRANRVATTLVAPQPLTGPRSAVATLGADRTMTLSVDGREVARGQAPQLLPSQPQDGLSVGLDDAGAVGPYETPFAFTGTIASVTVDLATPPTAPVTPGTQPDPAVRD